MTRKIRDDPDVLRAVLAPGNVPLPKAGETNILITSALPYCNNVPHLGNIIGSTLSADVFSRYNRARNRNTLYICGTDEYGTATERQALKEGKTPQELCDYYWDLHRKIYEWFELDFSYFGRTSTPKHTVITQDVYKNLRKNELPSPEGQNEPLLRRQETEQLYCEEDQKFLADRFVEGTCPNCGYIDARGDQCDSCSRTLDAVELINPRCINDVAHKVIKKQSTHMYLRLDLIQKSTEEWIKKSWKAGKWSPNAVVNVKGEIIDGRLRAGLAPSAITRDLNWGVAVPSGEGELDEGMEKKVIYCWFDAPLGYPSITANLTDDWEQWWFNPENVKLYQFMGKDNVYFHTVFFPSMLIGDGRPWTTLHHISATEYLNYEGGKFSKSRNLGVFGTQAEETGIPPSVWRYYLLSNRPESGDSMFSWANFIQANNSELLNNFGNFVNRALKFTVAKFQGTVPETGDSPGPLNPAEDDPDVEFVADINKLLTTYIEGMDAVRLRDSLQVVMQVSARGNLYLQHAGLSNQLLAEKPERCQQVIGRAINLIYALSALIFPFLPSTSESILTQLNAPARTIPDVFSNDALPGHVLGTPDYLFKRIDEKQAEIWRAKFGSAVAPVETSKGKAGAVAKGAKKTAGKKSEGTSKPKKKESKQAERDVVEGTSSAV